MSDNSNVNERITLREQEYEKLKLLKKETQNQIYNK